MRRSVLVAVTGFLVVAASVLLPSTPARAAAPRDPVVFVHGYASNGLVWIPMAARALAAGYPASRVYTFEYDVNQSLITSAGQLRSYVDGVRARTGASRVDLVNHSMGGLVTRYYLKNLGGTAAVDQWGSLAGANHGTTAAYACLLFTSCQQMAPNSAFLQQLNSGDETPGAVTYRTWYSACDGVIIPYRSTLVSGAVNTDVGCVNHLAFLTDGGVGNQVIDWLD
ncbi:triacylglycerol lipase [Micromonospora pattaloongensis]|uniref:Triacylglycerol lipase n=1 Tax=Micromonospora pattaloongensis TaxID=405436 RepID=A0A1H3NTV5_9ACTN|nr:alpha/beta fold hydrolase [Micromonospora pattaloongensis]SDY92351.1 triacylglycerol lipase [Micromonospora pattaloongensis]